jgi:chitinase
MKICNLKVVLLVPAFMLAIFVCFARLPDTNGKIVLAYVTSHGTIMPDPAYITHINYAFGHVNETFNGLRISNENRLKAIVGLKKQKASLKVMLSIGGWGSGRFSEMADDEIRRKSFAADCQNAVLKFGLDGIDLDWEYPGSDAAKISASPRDKDNFTLLMRDIRKAIGNDKLLTLASCANAEYIDFKAIDPYIDFVNIMTYDMATVQDMAIAPKHHAALYRSELTGWSCGAESLDAHIKAGIPTEKLTLGIPFYGHGKSGTLPYYVNYKDIIKLEGYTDNWDELAKVPYLTDANGNFVCTYENTRSIAIKCQYLLEHKMLGAMYWDYSGDDAEGTLRKAVWNGVMR